MEMEVFLKPGQLSYSPPSGAGRMTMMTGRSSACWRARER